MPRFLVDTNVLLRFVDPSAAEHQLAVSALRTLQQNPDNQLCVTAQNLVEFWSVATRPLGVNGLGLDPDRVQDHIALALIRFRFLEDDPTVFVRWQRLVRAHRVIGRQVHDARLAAVMLSYGVTHLLTLNVADFTRYPGITPVHPRDV